MSQALTLTFLTDPGDAGYNAERHTSSIKITEQSGDDSLAAYLKFKGQRVRYMLVNSADEPVKRDE